MASQDKGQHGPLAGSPSAFLCPTSDRKRGSLTERTQEDGGQGQASG